MKYRVGLDIGIKSVGYAVIENDGLTEEPVRIADLGVRTFDANEVDKTGESTAKHRRELRGVRRRRRRKEYRFERMTNVLNAAFKFDCREQVYKLQNVDVYMLRAKALDNVLTNAELCRIVFHMLKHRGFKSNRKEITADKTEGKLKQAIKKNQEFLQQSNYRTIGEAIYKDNNFKSTFNGKVFYDVRNHNDDYKNCFARADLEAELRLILTTQQALGNKALTNEFVDKIVSIFSAQRSFDVGPGKNSPYKAGFAVGNCTLLPGEKRAPKDSYTFERFTALSKLNSLRINDANLSEEQRNIVLDKINNCVNIKFSQIRKWLKLDYSLLFNLCNYYIGKGAQGLTEQEIIDKAESKDFVKFEKTISIRKALGGLNPAENVDLYNQIALMLSLCKSDATIDEYLQKHEIFNLLTAEQITALKTLNFDKFGSLSVRAMQQIIPYLVEGFRYDEACLKAGFNHSIKSFEKSKLLQGGQVQERLEEITTPTVKRAVNQSIRILNEIIKKYGSPQFVTVELARDFERTPNERIKIEKDQQAKYLQNQQYIDEIISKYKIKPSGTDILKLRLYNDQSCKCMYSGDPIDIDKLFSDNNYQIDHAIPISRSLDDSYNNKVLVKTSENQKKGDLTPFEYFNKFKTPAQWEEYVGRVNTLKSVKKRQILLTEKFSQDRSRDYIARNSNDTRYISRAMLNLMQDYLLLEPNKSGKTKCIKCINGGVTAYLRKCWGINKIREDGDAHHCVDAAVIAVATDGQVQKITKFNQAKEKYIVSDNLIISKSTGEVIETVADNETKDIEAQLLGKVLPKPYPNFVKELALRSTVKYDTQTYNDVEKQQLKDIGYLDEDVARVKPLFVSRMKSVKSTGAIHKDTMYSTKQLDKTGLLIKTVKLSDLSISDTPERQEIKGDLHPNKSIKDYYRPLDDRKLYLFLKESLIKDSNCFKNVPYITKPTKAGKQGMKVKTVKITVYKSDLALINGAAFENDKMYRIDIFKKQGKFYIIPVYMKDVYAHKLPNKIIAIGKPWVELDDSYEFQFSLYQNDLVKIKWNKQAKFSKVNKNETSHKPDNIEISEGLFYYNSCNISTASMQILTTDRCYQIGGVGVQNLANIQKYYVDIMGKVYKAPTEKRKEI